jgi:hypothetical protein
MENEYYGIATTHTDDYLAHYGVKGMKWGVRRALDRNNDRALGRQYRKAQKKLAKLERQASNGKKYAKRAARLGIGAAAAGGLAVAGTEGIRKGLGVGGNLLSKAGHGMSNLGTMARGSRNQIIRKAGMALDSAGRGVTTAGHVVGGNKVGNAISKWGNSTSAGQYLKVAGRNAQNAIPGNITAKLTGGKGFVSTTDKLGDVTNNTFARIGAGAIGAGLAGAAGYNAYRAATTKKAARKAAEFRKAMNETFKGTQYANGSPRQGNKRRKRR